MQLHKNIKKWYEGEFVPPDNSPNSRLIFVMGHYQRHWSSRVAHVVVDFYLKEWRWLLPFVVGVAGVIVAIAKLKQSGQ